MQLSSSKPCVVILTEKEVEVSVNNHATFTLPKNYLAAFACNNNVIELSTLNHVLITYINRNIINDYLLFLNKNLTCVKPWSRLATPVIACHSRTPEVFRLAANHSKQQPSKPCEAELTRALLFTVLSNFLEQSRFIALLMYILRSSVRDSVCRIIQSDIQHYWNLRIVASSLCLSPSLLKKKLKNENTSYSQIVTECRMRYAVQMLLMDNKNITQVAQLCGYSNTSYFISVFKAFYGLTPLNYLAKQRQKVMW
ncbi:DNA-binding transcriptional regulator EnvY [Escherichia coli]|uniref:DNA-binding transcriptional regulator EnvY n=1 Tax=Escherichia coli TaxID=562 RepID=UPI002DB8A603|nr:DNA-binding transcriptional regulator EnvY [Escherichia coli]MEC3732246.1 DNA-binding transcriptional regulator EnvY [Escherichia coli]